MITGLATMIVPKTDNNQAIVVTGLSDQMAMSYGTLFAQTLSEQDSSIEVTLECGSIRAIGLDNITGQLTIGRLE